MPIGKVYTLEVDFTQGPVTEKFLRKNPIITRDIQIRGSQTLHALHRAIFKAFDREEEHMYEFQIGGRRPMDPKARRYQPVCGGNDFFLDQDPPGNAAKTRLDALKLKTGDHFFYWFDFGDDWYHEIQVNEMGAFGDEAKLPRVIARKGASPPQYPDFEEEESESSNQIDTEVGKKERGIRPKHR